MENFLTFLSSDKYITYVCSSYLVCFFVLLFLKISSHMKEKKTIKQYTDVKKKHER